MASFPSVTTIPTITITSSNVQGVTYQSLLNSFNSQSYSLTGFYIQSTTLQQLALPISFTTFDANGNQITNVKTIVPSMFQSSSISAVDVDLSGMGIVLDGFTSMNFPILPNQEIFIVFYVDNARTIDLASYLIEFIQSNEPNFRPSK